MGSGFGSITSNRAAVKTLVCDTVNNVDGTTPDCSGSGGGGGGGISFNGSTANGVVTYGNATTADVESNLTYDHASSLLTVNGGIVATAYLSVAGAISGSSTLKTDGTITTAGALNVTGTITAAGIASGSLAGDGSYVGLNSSNQLVLTASSGGAAASDGWHGSTTRIKILPRDFISNDDNYYGTAQVKDENTSLGIKVNNSLCELYAYVPIPTAYKATHVRAYCSATPAVNVEAFEGYIDGTAAVSKGTGDTSAEIDITDVDSTTTNYLIIHVATTANSDVVHGGYVTIAAM